MDTRDIEPRKTVWAVAEVLWQEADGTPSRAPATLEDTSISGACLRVKRQFPIGSRVTIKWHREQFSAIARNCRRDGREFLVGVRREVTCPPKEFQANDPPASKPATIHSHHPMPQNQKPSSVPDVNRGNLNQTSSEHTGRLVPDPRFRDSSAPTRPPVAVAKAPPAHPLPLNRVSNSRSRSERKAMPSKSIFPQFWRRQQDGDVPTKSTSTEAPVNKPTNHASEATSAIRSELLSYEDIYRAAGIMSPGSGYGIHKVVDMLNSERIRDLSKDVKRASVLMALDAAGIAVDELLTDATRRQNALNTYEAGQRKQLEDFESRKGQENARIEEEMEKIRAHYAERIQKNLDLVAKEKETLRNWQSAMQHESRRIAEVIELCGKPPAARSTLAAAAGAQKSAEKSPVGADTASSNLLGKP